MPDDPYLSGNECKVTMETWSDSSAVRSPAFRRKLVTELDLRMRQELPPKGGTTNFLSPIKPIGVEKVPGTVG